MRCMENPEVLRDVTMATNFVTQFAITGFLAFNGAITLCVIASDKLSDSKGRF